MVHDVKSVPARRAASPASANAACSTGKRRGRPVAIESQATKRARKHAGKLDFQPAAVAGKTTRPPSDQRSDAEESSSQQIGVFPLLGSHLSATWILCMLCMIAMH